MPIGQSQNFCSYLICTDDTDGFAGAAAAYVPHLESEGLRAVHRKSSVHFFPATGNPLHAHFVRAEGSFLFFLQGEFYDEVPLEGLSECVRPDGIDTGRLGSFLRGLNGVFSGSVVDTERGETCLFTDRFGFSRQYYRESAGAVVAASNIWPFLGSGLSGGINKAAVRDILMCGFPLGDETPCGDVFVVQPGTIVRVGPGGTTSIPYYDYTRRAGGPEDFVRSFQDAAAEHFATVQAKADTDALCLSLSGGHDSRVILNAMLHCGLEPHCFTGFNHHLNSDSKRAGKVARIAKCPSTVFNYSDLDEQDVADVNILLDGAGTGGWSMNLGKVARDEGQLLYFGSSGDLLSGGWGVQPQKYANATPLVEDILEAYFYEYASPQDKFFRMMPDRNREDMVARLFADFPERPDQLSDAFLENRIKVRNFRRIRMFMQGSYLYHAPVHFFHDNRISDLYWRVPLDLLAWQKLHTKLCGMASFRLGWIPATNYPIPAITEPWLLPMAKKLMVKGLKKRLLVSESGGRKIPQPSIQSSLDVLEQFNGVLDLDLEALRSFIADDPTGRLLLLRMGYVTTMLKPQESMERSRLFDRCGFKDVIPTEN